MQTLNRSVTTPASGCVSVVIPTFNRAKYLPDAVHSVLRQTYRDLELIVVDDGSTDGTAEVLRPLASDPRMRTIRIAHTGSPARARNAGIAQARGRYLAFLDSDDVWLPEKVDAQLRALAACPRCRWTYTLFDHIADSGTWMAPLQGGVSHARSGWIVEHMLTDDALVMVQSVVAEADLIHEVGGFDEHPALREDLDLCLRLAMRSEACAVDRVLLRVRHHTDRTTFGLPEVRLWKVRALEKLAGSTSDRRVRTLCRRAFGRELVDLARVHDWHGRPGAALRTLGRAFWCRPWDRGWWGTFAKTIVRPVVPVRVLDRYRRFRRRGAPEHASSSRRDG